MPTITSATSGLSNATSTWVGGVVPVVGDKVIIAHPGSNGPAGGTPYTTGASALVAGATSIPLVGGTGSIVAGESVQLEVQTGVDADGQPVISNAYYRVTTGITAAGQSLVIAAPGLAVDAPAGTRVVNAGHVVTLQGSHTWGDDTSSTTPSACAITPAGTLRWPRDSSASLTCRGTLFLDSGGTLDMGARGDTPNPDVTASLVINDSSALAAGKHVVTSLLRTNPRWRMRGAVRTRNTRLTAGTLANANSITVDASLGWRVGDRVVIASDTDSPSRAQVVTITAGASPNWTVSSITNARLAGTRVGNLSGNVVLRAISAANPAGVNIAFASASAAPFAVVDVGDLRCENIGSANAWVLQNTPGFYGLGLTASGMPPQRISRVACENTGGVIQQASVVADQPSASIHTFDDIAVLATGRAIFSGNAASSEFLNVVTYGSSNDIGMSFGAMTYCRVNGGEAWSLNSPVLLDSSYAAIIAGRTMRSPAQALTTRLGSVRFEGCSFSTPGVSTPQTVFVSGGGVFVNCSFTGAALAGSNSLGLTPQKSQTSQLIAVNGSASDSRVVGHFIAATTDLTTRRRSTYSVQIRPAVANTSVPYTFTIPAVAGVAQTIRGSLRFDATYGTATPPLIELAGQGVTASFAAPAAADTWHDFTLTFTPTTTGDITATVTVQSASTAGLAWLDGVYHFPMTQSVRHFGFQWLPQAAQIADPRITLTEAAALALPVVEDHTAQTITVSGPVTARQVFEAAMADLCQTANQARPVHITSATGDTFTTSYTVVLTGAGAITGVYTDTTGVRVPIAAPALVSGSRVQLFNLTDAAEFFNGVLSATGLLLPITWTANKTIRLRAEHPDKLPLQTLGVLTSAGLSFLDVQADDTVYMSNGIDGSTCTEFNADGPNIQVDINDPDGVTSVQRLYAWMQWYQTTAGGIATSFFGALVAIDSATYLVDQAAADIRLDNVSAQPVRVVGGYLARKDGSTIIAAASNSIQMDPGKAYVAPLNALSIPAGERVVTLQPSGAVLARG